MYPQRRTRPTRRGRATRSVTVDADRLRALIARELDCVSDPRVLSHVRALLVEPTPILRAWDYGPAGQRYACWSVLEHPLSRTGIAYCEEGFGPRCPWGLIWLDEPTSMGMDCNWYLTFLDAFFDSRAPEELDIWRVFRIDRSGAGVPLSEEGGWDETWQQIERFRAGDPDGRYDCNTSANPRFA